MAVLAAHDPLDRGNEGEPEEMLFEKLADYELKTQEALGTGWAKKRIYVFGANGRPLFRSKVNRNWPSQGRVEFLNKKKLCWSDDGKALVDGNPVRCFCSIQFVKLVYERELLVEKVHVKLREQSLQDRQTLRDLICERMGVGPKCSMALDANREFERAFLREVDTDVLLAIDSLIRVSPQATQRAVAPAILPFAGIDGCTASTAAKALPLQ